MNELLGATAEVLCEWLEPRLSSLTPQWWRVHVVERLTFQQQRLVEEKGIVSLKGLDVAAVLRVLDQNWHELSTRESLPREMRTWVKELQSARNRWAHAPVGGLVAKDTYRDADTLERLLATVGADGAIVARVDRFKVQQVAAMAVQAASSPVIAAARDTGAAKTIDASKFAAGQLVRLRSNPNVVVPVLDVVPAAGSETRYRVFENGAKQDYYESQIESYAEPEVQRAHIQASELSALLSAVHLSTPSASALYSLNAGRVRFVPYQYRPVFKLIRADRPRLLIADEVGVGKTIEAGLILKELQARHDIRSVLIICPKALVAERKWELEMKRFDERFTPLDGRLLRHCLRETHLSGEWPVQYEKVILPSSLFDNDLLMGKEVKGKKREYGLLDLDPPPKFDLVVVDEAHHIRNTETYLHKAVRYFADNAEAVVFMSATPVQLGRNDLYTILNTLRPDVIIDQASFAQMAEPNQFINTAIQACRRGEEGWPDQVRELLRSVAGTVWGRKVLAVDPGFQHVYDALADGASAGEMRVRAITALEEMYTFGDLINRTRRRDIGAFTTRKAETVTTEFTASQRALHDDLLGLIARIFEHLHGTQQVKFLMTTVSRQAASCLYGLAPTLEDMLQGKLDRLEGISDDDEDFEAAPTAFSDAIRRDAQALAQRARQLDPMDPKAEAFLRVIDDKLAMPKNKVLVFSTFRHTLRYLEGKLTEKGVRFGLIHGGIVDEERAELRRRFALPSDNPDALDVQLSSEVGCEGLDFQFCDCLINYDLPWNPMRIEQRIGRIDRYGQESETVAIINLITPGTIDADIYERCLMRIGVFQHAIGGNEEILGDITRELHSIAESVTLSEDERRRRLQQLSDNKIRQIQEESRLEEQQGELFGLNIAAASWEHRLERSRNPWLEPPALAEAVRTYLSRRLGRQQDYLIGDKLLKTLRLNQEARAALLEDYRVLPRSNDPTHRAWEKWLKGGVPTLSVTFDQTCAVGNAAAVLLSLGHPLIRQAALSLQPKAPVSVRLRAIDETVPPGVHPFVIYRWARQGAKRDEELLAVAEDAQVGGRILPLLQVARDAPDLQMPASDVWDALEATHHQLWLKASSEHAADNRQLVSARRQSLEASHAARRGLLLEQITNASSEKIRIMKQAELSRAQADCDARMATLVQAADSGDIRATATVFGILEIQGAR